MKATDILESEHRIIEQVLSCLERMADLDEEHGKLDCGPARDMIEFLRVFADRFHHAKEERHLFTALESRGMPRDGGPTGVMLAEHEMGRDLVGKMEQAVIAFERGDPAVLKDFVSAVRVYVPMLREHIQKEDHCLFAMTNENLSVDEQARLLESFLSEEVERPGEKPADHYREKARELALKYRVAPAGSCASSGCGPKGRGGCGGGCS